MNSNGFQVLTKAGPNTQVVQGIPIGRLNKLEQQVAALIAQGTGGFSIKTATPAADGTTTTFTFSAAPTVIITDQGRVLTNGNGVAITGVTAVLDVAPTFNIFGF